MKKLYRIEQKYFSVWRPIDLTPGKKHAKKLKKIWKAYLKRKFPADCKVRIK